MLWSPAFLGRIRGALTRLDPEETADISDCQIILRIRFYTSWKKSKIRTPAENVTHVGSFAVAKRLPEPNNSVLPKQNII